MAKVSTQYLCQACGATSSRWSGRCMNCGEWGSIVENISQTISRSNIKLTPQKLEQIKSSKSQRYKTNITEVDKVLGGGIVPASLTLLSGDPGIGKSTLALQIITKLSEQEKVLYISGEESASQIKMRSERIKFGKLDFDLVCSNDIEAVIDLCSTNNYKVVIIDSIQTMYSSTISSAAGSVSQITNNTNLIARLAKASDVAFIIVGHVTKEGSIAGPKLLEHLVDTVLYLEGERSGGFKVLRSVKNRFGSTSEVGIFAMSDEGLSEVKNPSQYLLSERQLLPGSVVIATMEGTRPLLVEVQALVSSSVFGFPKRTAVGVDLNRMQLLCAVATKRGGLRLSDKDIYVNIVGGLKIQEPALDIAIILAIASAEKNITLPKDLVVFGEVGLSGEIRSVSYDQKRIAEANKLGYSKILAPYSTKNATYKPKNIVDAIAEFIK